MGMCETIRNFPKQFEYEPVVENAEYLKKHAKFVVLGMGGSHLAADFIKVWNPFFDIVVHSDYGLPEMRREVLEKSLLIASSYSGNTEEALDGFTQAREAELPLAAISVGGKLLALAKEAKIPYVELPDTGIQPRSALGFSIKGLFKIIGDEKALDELKTLAGILDPGRCEKQGKTLAKKLKGTVPLVYGSRKNYPIAYSWKIKFNETGKIPAFCNSIPELNHNEMTGFDVKGASKPLSERFYFLFLRDSADHPKVQKRMEILERLYKDRGLRAEALELAGRTQFEKIFSSLLLADWTSYYTAEQYGLEPEQVPMVEEFKKFIV